MMHDRYRWLINGALDRAAQPRVWVKPAEPPKATSALARSVGRARLRHDLVGFAIVALGVLVPVALAFWPAHVEPTAPIIPRASTLSLTPSPFTISGSGSDDAFTIGTAIPSTTVIGDGIGGALVTIEPSGVTTIRGSLHVVGKCGAWTFDADSMRAPVFAGSDPMPDGCR